MENFYENGYYDVSEDALENEKNIKSGNEGNYERQVVFDTKNYLNVKLGEGETTKTIRVRLLPFPETKSPFLHIHMHTLKVPAEISKSGWKSYVCLEKTEGLDESLGRKCPFCDVAKSAFRDMKNEPDPEKKQILKERGKQNIAKEVVVMRCIERGKEDEGVKFWKVNVHQTKDDPYNLIYTLWETRKAEWLADPENKDKDRKESNILSINDYGYDLTITIKKKAELDQRSGKTVEKTSYQITDAKKPSPLSTDPEQAKSWVCDPKKWFEVFVPKPYDYLALVMQGKLPWFDRATGKWVSREMKEEQKANEVAKAEAEIKRAEAVATQALTEHVEDVKTQALKEDPVGVFGDNPDDDLPF